MRHRVIQGAVRNDANFRIQRTGEQFVLIGGYSGPTGGVRDENIEIDEHLASLPSDEGISPLGVGHGGCHHRE